MQDRAMHWPNAPVQEDPPPGSENSGGSKTGYGTEVPKPQPKED
jgi:hypothetical protein